MRIPNRRLNVNVTLNHDFYDPETDGYRRPWLERLVVNTSLNLVGSRRSDQRELNYGDNRGFGSSTGMSGSGGFDSGLGSGNYDSGFGSTGGYGDDRFNQRFDQVKGPWTVKLTHRYVVRRTNPAKEFSTSSHEIRAVNRFTLNDITDPLRLSNPVTNSLRIQHSINYDYRRRKIVSHSLDLYRQLHCWEFTFRWVPNGINKGIYFRLNLLAHPEVKIEQERRSGG